jgi:hypothetical protein
MNCTWECQCGHIEYSSLQPDECSECLSIKSFAQLPEEVLNERENDNFEDSLKPNILSNNTQLKETVKKKTKKKIKRK